MVRFILGKKWVVKKNLRPTKVEIRVKCLFNLISCVDAGEEEVRCSATRMLRLFRVIIGAVLWVRVRVRKRVSGIFGIKVSFWVRLDRNGSPSSFGHNQILEVCTKLKSRKIVSNVETQGITWKTHRVGKTTTAHRL